MKEVADLKAGLADIKNLQCSFDVARRQARVELAREQLHLLGCKICKDTPTLPVVLVTCCRQMLGCATCYESCVERSECCPLCRAPDTNSIIIEGLDPLYSFLRGNFEEL